MIYIGDSLNNSNYVSDQEIKRICTNIIDRHEDTFKKLANEKFSQELELVTKSKLCELDKTINELINSSIDHFASTRPVDLIVNKIYDELNPQISQAEELGILNIGLGITNLIIFTFLLFNVRK